MYNIIPNCVLKISIQCCQYCLHIFVIVLQNDGDKQVETVALMTEQVCKMQATIVSHERQHAQQEIEMAKLKEQLEDEMKVRRQLQETLNKTGAQNGEGWEDMEQQLQGETQQPVFCHVESESEKKLKELKKKCVDMEEELKRTAERLGEQERKREESQRKAEEYHKMLKQKSHTLTQKQNEDFDVYFDQVTKLTIELTELNDKSAKQKKEMERLQRMEKRAEQIEEENVKAVSELSRQELEMKLHKEIPASQKLTENVDDITKEDGHAINKLKKKR